MIEEPVPFVILKYLTVDTLFRDPGNVRVDGGLLNCSAVYTVGVAAD